MRVFIVDRTDVPQGRVSALSIVEDLDAIEDLDEELALGYSGTFVGNLTRSLSSRRNSSGSPNDASRFVHPGGYRMDYIASFFAGALLCNSIPHLACGLRGETFPTPFANPRGKGPSAPYREFPMGGRSICSSASICFRGIR